MPPRFVVHALPDSNVDLATLKRWFRQFVEVRDADGAERCIVSAVRAGATDRQMADMLFAAATDHRYIQGGHTLDFTNKALEALECAGWELAEPTLASLATIYATLGRVLLREDRDFHTIQAVEAACQQYSLLGDTSAGRHVLIAAARYLAAHAPTMRAQGQTFHMARRLSRGERLDETA